MGYHRAGFDVVGVDIEPQPRYPFTFIRADALVFLRDERWAEFDAIHASPPCQAYSDLQKQNKREYPDLIAQTRELLQATGMPYVIENVEGAPLVDPITLCGTMFPELRVYRHRNFESNIPLSTPEHPVHAELTFTHDKRKKHYGQPLDLTTMRVQVTGGGNAPVWAKRAAMGIDWMTGRELNEAIPPTYTQHIGPSLMRAVMERAA